MPPADKLSTLAEAFNFMKYDVALLADEEQLMLERAKVAPPHAWKTASQEALTVVETPNGTVGFLRFPPLPEGTDIPDDTLIEAVTRSVARYKPTVDLLVGISPWGAYGEKEYLDQHPDQVPQVLLGSGRGMSFVKRFASSNRVLWSRPYPRGKTITRIAIDTWPKGNDFEWTSDAASAGSELLNDSVYENPHVRGIFENAGIK